MKRNITFSRTFPAYHPKAGQPTFFVEGILTQLGISHINPLYFNWLCENNPKIDVAFLKDFWHSLSKTIQVEKSHTIRSHKKPLKAGDYINPVCWAGKPYNKTADGYWQIKFAPDVEVKKTWEFKIDKNYYKMLPGDYDMDIIISHNFYNTSDKIIKQVALNDGLNLPDFLNWFKYPSEFTGNIYCWNENINY